MLPAKQFRVLHNLIDEIFNELWKQYETEKEVAHAAGLGVTTVNRLASYTTLYPRTQTVMLLAQAAGYSVQLVQSTTKNGSRPKLRIVS